MVTLSEGGEEAKTKIVIGERRGCDTCRSYLGEGEGSILTR